MTFSLKLKTEQTVSLPQPAIMGIINLSADSFFNPHSSLNEVKKTVDEMKLAGVNIIDVGGEATNPKVDLNNATLNPEQELALVVPAVTAIRRRFDGLISVDTSNVNVMRAAVAAGADLINDQRALMAQGALQAVAELKVPVVLMHFFNKRTPGSTSLEQLLQTVQDDLLERVQACVAAGIDKQRIILDPGFGQGNYGKNCEENFYLLAKLPQFVELGFPLLSGWSRKSMLGEVLGGVPASERLFASVAANSLAAFLGAHILRVHDVKAACDASQVVNQLKAFV